MIYEEALDIIIKIFTIFGSILGILAFYFAYTEYKRKVPKIECYTEQSEYEIGLNNNMTELLLKLRFVVNNSGGVGTSITGCEGFLRFHHSMAKYTDGVINTQANESVFPIDIEADSSRKFELTFTFKTNYNDEFFDRCGVAIDLSNPKKWEWKDLPILARFAFRHTKGTFETTACVFRNDVPESKRKIYLGTGEHFRIKQDFYPESPKNDK